MIDELLNLSRILLVSFLCLNKFHLIPRFKTVRAIIGLHEIL